METPGRIIVVAAANAIRECFMSLAPCFVQPMAAVFEIQPNEIHRLLMLPNSNPVTGKDTCDSSPSAAPMATRSGR
jgi:hypothetical protein